MLSYIIIFINMLVFGLEIIMGGSTNIDTLILMGAKVNELIDAGQYWRFITPMFLHIGVMHLTLNMYAIKNIGPFVETVIGKLGFLTIYIFGGIAGNVMSYFFSPRVSAGASTSIFGLFGAVVVAGLAYRKNAQIKKIGWSSLRIVLLNLVLNIFQPGIDLFGHLGGFLGGVLMATAWVLLFPNKNIVPNNKRTRQIS